MRVNGQNLNSIEAGNDALEIDNKESIITIFHGIKI